MDEIVVGRAGGRIMHTPFGSIGYITVVATL